MVDAEGRLPLPWLAGPLADALRTQKGHALLVHGPQGIGQFELALSLAQSWLCEDLTGGHACGHCASCHLVQARSHPDLLVLLPEALAEALGWTNEEATSDKASKAKPSKELKVEAIRAAVLFAQTTSARGRGKVVLVHPAERMNMISGNTLLKTLEEPPGEARFILSCGAPQDLLPTIRSRCQAVPLALPDPEVARRWLADHQVAQPDVLLAAAGEPAAGGARLVEGRARRGRVDAPATPGGCRRRRQPRHVAAAAPARRAAQALPRRAVRRLWRPPAVLPAGRAAAEAGGRGGAERVVEGTRHHAAARRTPVERAADGRIAGAAGPHRPRTARELMPRTGGSKPPAPSLHSRS